MCISGADYGLRKAQRVLRSKAITAWRVFDLVQRANNSEVLKAAFRDTQYRPGTKMHVTRDDPTRSDDYGFHAMASLDQVKDRFEAADVRARVLLWGTVVIEYSFDGTVIGYRATRMRIVGKTISKHYCRLWASRRRIAALRKVYA